MVSSMNRIADIAAPRRGIKDAGNRIVSSASINASGRNPDVIRDTDSMMAAGGVGGAARKAPFVNTSGGPPGEIDSPESDCIDAGVGDLVQRGRSCIRGAMSRSEDGVTSSTSRQFSRE